MDALNQLKRLPENKAQIETFVNAAIGEILSGEISPLEVEIRLKVLADTIALIRKDVRVKRVVMEEAEQYNNQSFFNTDIKVIVRKTADYSADTIHTTLKAQMKARETLLKECKGCDPDTGEVVVTYKESEVLTLKLK